MMRVEISMDETVRGLVSKYASEKGVTMPKAYQELILNGLVISDVEFPTFSPDVDIDDQVLTISKMEPDEYEIVMADGDE